MIDAAAAVVSFDEIDSTLLEARRRADAGALTPVWLIAKRQSAGRGRRGRTWQSQEGNLFATYLGPVAAPPGEIALLGFATGLAIAEAIEAALSGVRVALKWPNDVLISGEKCAGILLDSGATQGCTWLALAFGVNLTNSPGAIDQPTTHLGAHLPPDAPAPEAAAFLASVRTRLTHWDDVLAREGFAPVRDAWLKRAHGLGREAKVVQG
ncbi:MAG: biotin--[acetyl-CoA-carboxylase] ligase, partial [Hyphomonadaceae bacterium]